MKKSLQYGMGLWFATDIWLPKGWTAAREKTSSTNEIVAVQSVRNLTSSPKLLPKVHYFRIILDLSGECSYRAKLNGDTYTVSLSPATAMERKRTTRVKNEYVERYTVKDDDGTVEVRVSLKQKDVDAHCYLMEPSYTNKSYRLFIDIGFLDDNAMEEIDKMDVIDAVETNLSFGPLVLRKATQRVVIHHVGNTNADVSAANIHRWHLGNGWSGIGYHFVIRKDGKIERGRPQETMGAHAYHYNGDSIGICLTGEFDAFYPTAAQMGALNRLVTRVCRHYSIPPDRGHIFGHRDLNATKCPGDNLYQSLDAVCGYARVHSLDK